MAEYLVVASALMTAFFWGANADCPGYDNCIDKLKTVMHDKYEGYSHSISAVHRYGDTLKEGFEGSPAWGDGVVSGPGNDGTDGGDIEEREGLVREDVLTSPDGSTTYGTLSGSEIIYDDDGNAISIVQYVVDGDGNVIGTYNPDDGTITFLDGETESALAASIVTDENGDPVDLQAVIDCSTQEVYAFGYKSGATGDFHNSLTLETMDISGYCLAPTYGVVDEDGNSVNGAIVGENYYGSTYSVEIVPGSPRTPTGEVVYFNIEVPNDSKYDDSSPGIGERVEDCAVMANSWDADSSMDELDVYLNSTPNPRVGSLDPDAGIPCPSAKQVTD